MEQSVDIRRTAWETEKRSEESEAGLNVVEWWAKGGGVITVAWKIEKWYLEE